MTATDWRAEPGLMAWSAFLRAHAAVVPAVEREVAAGARFPLSWYDVLLELNGAPGRRLRMQELADVVVLSRSRVSRVVDELEEAGLVARQPNPDDLRSSYAAITAPGRRALRRVAPVYLEAVRRHFVAVLTPAQIAVLAEALEGLATGPRLA